MDSLCETLRRCSTPDECRACIKSGLAAEEQLLDRNAQISSSYAALYLRHPRLFKWSGMAAFASQHVRKLLWLKASSERDRSSAAMLSRLMSITELETIRTINNAIHDDIFWAHMVYDGCEDGADRVRFMVQGTPMEPLADGFALIENGRMLLKHNEQRGVELIVRGNIALLRHEQEAVVQPHLSLLSCAFARVFSLGSSLNYEPRGIMDCLRYCSSFYAFMIFREWVRLVRSRSLPRLDLLEHRWLWIERVLVPKFIALEQGAAAIKISGIRNSDHSNWML
ncbi:MAG: DUF2515 family protein, partial [Phycisphaerales bacterium]